MKRFYNTIICLLLSIAAGAATPIVSIDELELLSECVDDATQLGKADSLLHVFLGRKDIARDPNYAQLLYLKSMYYVNNGDFAASKALLTDMLGRFDRGEFEGMAVDAPNDLRICLLHDLGLCYRRASQNDSALYYYEKAMTAAQRYGDKEWEAALCSNIGVLHYNLGHLNECEPLFDHAYELIRNEDDPYTELSILQIRATVKQRLSKPEEARTSIERAYQLALEAESPDWQLRCMTTMLTVYNLLNLPDSAALTLERGNRLLPLLPQQGITAIGYLTARGNYLMSKGQWQQAAADLQTVTDSPTGGVRTCEAFDHLSICYSHLGQWQLAYRYKDSALVYATRENEERFAAQMADLSVRYQTMEKDMQIAQLETQRTRLEAQRTRIIIIVVATAMLLLLAGIAVWLVQRQRRYRHEAQMRIDTLEQERARIARELHDGLCNDLLGLEMQMATGSAASTDVLTGRLQELRHQARSLSHQLMPPAFDHLSLSDLLRHYARNTTNETGLQLSFKTEPTTAAPQLSAAVSHELYRIVQEHTSNILKGGTALNMDITLTPTQLIIADDGTPQPANQPTDQPTGIGQRTTRDRALSIGAHMSTKTADGHNFMVIDLPDNHLNR